MKRELTPQEYQRLSEYLDGQLSAAEIARLETRLTVESDLREELDALRVTRQMLRSAPKRRAPRSFALTPEMVAKVRPAGVNRWFTTFRFASALAALLLVAVFVGELALGSRSLSAPQAVSMQTGAAEDSGAREFGAEQPLAEAPFITWGTPTPDFGPGAVLGMGGAAPQADGIGGGAGGGGGEGPSGVLQPGPIIEMTLEPTEQSIAGEPEASNEMQKSAPNPSSEPGVAAAPQMESAPKDLLASGPILGVTGGTESPTATATDVSVPERGGLLSQSTLRIAEVALALLALVAGLAAWYFARKPSA